MTLFVLFTADLLHAQPLGSFSFIPLYTPIYPYTFSSNRNHGGNEFRLSHSLPIARTADEKDRARGLAGLSIAKPTSDPITLKGSSTPTTRRYLFLLTELALLLFCEKASIKPGNAGSKEKPRSRPWQK